MAKIGEVVIGISAKLDGLEKGAAKSQNIIREMSRGIRQLSMAAKGAGLARLGTEAASFIDGIVHRIDDLKKAAEETGLSISQLSHGMIDDADIGKIEDMKSAFDDLKNAAQDFWITVVGSEFITDVSDNLTALLVNTKKQIEELKAELSGGKDKKNQALGWMNTLVGMVGGSGGMLASHAMAAVMGKNADTTPVDATSAAKVKAERAQADIQKKNQKAREDEKKALQKGIDERNRMREEAQEKIDRTFGGRAAEDMQKVAKFRATGASEEQIKEYQEQLAKLREVEKMKEQMALEEKMRQDEAKTRQKELADAEKAWADIKKDRERDAQQMIDSLMTKQDKYAKQLEEIKYLELTKNLTKEQADALRKKAMEDTMKDLDTGSIAERQSFGALDRGSQEAFSAINKFRLGGDKNQREEKDRKEMVRALKSIEKKIEKENTPPVAGL